MEAEPASDAVRASWLRAYEELTRAQADVVFGDWAHLARQSLVLGSAALDLGITASHLPTKALRRVDDVVTALLRASDLGLACARLGPTARAAADDVAQAFHDESARAVAAWRLVEAQGPAGR